MIVTLSILLALLAALFIGFSVYSWYTTWRPYTGEVKDEPREGNPTAPRTLPGLEWFFETYIWKTAIIFEATEPGIFAGVGRVGKTPRVSTQFISGNKFAVKLSREYRIYFAVNTEGKRVKIRPLERLVPINDPRLSKIPLV